MKQIDTRTRQIDKIPIDSRNNYYVRQQAQNQLLAIQAEQKQNMNEARVEGQTINQNNANLAQAGAVAAEAASDGQVQTVDVNPQTQQILSQYGYNSPGVSKTSNRTTTQQTKQNITINNHTTTTNTTNNVNHINGGGGPTQGRAVSVTNDGLPKFKVWLNNTIARQNEQAAKRDKIYEKRENELERNSNKMYRKLEASTKALSERLSPDNIRAEVKKSIKTILAMFGLHLLVSNWEIFLNKLSDFITKFNRFFGIGLEDGQQAGLVKILVKMIGGEKGETLIDAIKGLAESIVVLLKEAFTNLIDNRRSAVRLVDKPSGKEALSVGNWMDYIGKVIEAALLGTSKMVEEHTPEEVHNKFVGEDRISGKYLDNDGTTIRTANENGTLNLEGGKKVSSMFAHDVNEVNTTDALESTIPVGEILSELHLIEETIEKNGSIILTREFYHGLGHLGVDVEKELSSAPLNQGSYIGKYLGKGKYVKDDNGNTVLALHNDERKEVPKSGIEGRVHPELYMVNKAHFDYIKNRIGESLGMKTGSFGLDQDEEYVNTAKKLKDYLIKKRWNTWDRYRDDHTYLGFIDTSHAAWNDEANFDSDIDKNIAVLEAEIQRKKKEEKFTEDLNNSQVKAAVNGSKEVVSSVGNKVNNVVSGAKNIANNLFTSSSDRDGYDGAESSEDGNGSYSLPEDGWDMNETMDYLENNAYSGTHKDCALHVRRALNHGGLHFPKGHAYTYANGKLEKLGFEEITNNGEYKDGDILVTKNYGNHEYGHIAMWSERKNKWISDFIQDNPKGLIYDAGPIEKSNQVLYRYNPDKFKELYDKQQASTNLTPNQSTEQQPQQGKVEDPNIMDGKEIGKENTSKKPNQSIALLTPPSRQINAAITPTDSLSNQTYASAQNITNGLRNHSTNATENPSLDPIKIAIGGGVVLLGEVANTLTEINKNIIRIPSVIRTPTYTTYAQPPET